VPGVTSRWDLRPPRRCGPLHQGGAGAPRGSACYGPAIDEGLSQEALRELVDAAPDAIIVADGAGRLVLANRQAEHLFGRSRDDLQAGAVEDLLPDRFRKAHRGHRADFGQDPRTRAMGTGLVLHACRADGSEFPVEVSLSPLRSGGDIFTVAAVRDVTERVEAEDQLRAAARELTLLEDRERIARDLHDTVVQRLFAAGMALQGIGAMIGRESEATKRIDALVDELDEAIRDLRTAIYGLQPRGEHGPGFREQILQILSEATATLPSDPRLRFEGVLDATPDRVIAAALPALRELVSNVARHAGAKTVEVSIEASDDLVVRVADDGCGIDPGAASHGHGLVNLAERASELAGTFTIEDRPGGGTIAIWRVPNR
jgi:PAS domain S-box-containing protein